MFSERASIWESITIRNVWYVVWLHRIKIGVNIFHLPRPRKWINCKFSTTVTMQKRYRHHEALTQTRRWTESRKAEQWRWIEYVTGFRLVMAGWDMVNYTSPWVWISQVSLTQLKVLAFLLYLLVSAILSLYLKHTSFSQGWNQKTRRRSKGGAEGQGQREELENQVKSQ